MINHRLNFLIGRVRCKSLVRAALVFASLCIMQYATAISLSQSPLFVGQSAKPTIMLAMSRDQELYYKAYPDYSNLNGGALTMADTTYRNDFEYYGYFDPNWCYVYNANASVSANSLFTPEVLASNHQCSGMWSGNFLNWAAMTRIDVLRKVLFGGKRSVDTAVSGSTAAETVLERSYLPKDSHAFVKVYKSSSSTGEISKYTPYTGLDSTELGKEGVISLCNVSAFHPTVLTPSPAPLIRVASGDWTQWSHTEIQQCQWAGDLVNGSLPADRTSSPPLDNKLGELVAKVKVCVPDKDAAQTNSGILVNQYNEASNPNARCKSYESNSFKPIGLLQKNYTKINFGLVTGTWGKREQGGVLRKPASRLAGNEVTGEDKTNEFSEDTGVFNNSVTYGIIKDINLLRLTDYVFDSNNNEGRYAFANDWINPIGEIYAETLRYIIGKSVGTSTFDADDSGRISGLTRVPTNEWNDPVPASQWCSNCSILLISSGPNSMDGDHLVDDYLKTIKTGFNRTTLNAKTDAIGLLENGTVKANVFYGDPGANYKNQCLVLSKSFSELKGVCPAAPASKGSYDVAGLAYWAHTTDQRADGATTFLGKQVISTYAVELSEGLPNFDFKLGDSPASFVPVCTNNHTAACSLVGVVVENITETSGSYLFYWEDQTAASDYDMDAVQRIEYCIGPVACKNTNFAADQVQIRNSIPYWATGTGRMYMNYNINGVTVNGLNVTGVQDDQWVTRGGYDKHGLSKPWSLGRDDWYNTIGPAGKDMLPADTTDNKYLKIKLYGAGTSSVRKVESPLFYAAKYGSFNNSASNSDANDLPDQVAEWDSFNLSGSKTPDGIPDNYFAMKNPAKLEVGLAKIFDNMLRKEASGSGVATNSARVDTETTYVFQARFYTEGWYGELRALSLTSGNAYNEVWSTKSLTIDPTSRKVISYNPEAKAQFEFKTSSWSSLSETQKAALGSTLAAGQNVMNWVRGSEVPGYRARTKLDNVTQQVGDIINSTPVYSGAASQGYEKLGAEFGSASYKTYVTGTKTTRQDVVFAGANDGMLHAFNADTGAELFTYIPSMIYDKLPLLASPDYGGSINHMYSVDGPITVGDAYINDSWRTVLVGTLGGGGRGLFALDVTDVNSPTVLFEITPENYSDIGNVLGKPFIAPLGDRWKVVVGNGYNGGAGTAKLMVFDLQFPFNDTYSKAIATNTAVDNGLSTPAIYQSTATGASNYIYAGDLLGNMWKFTVGTATATDWKVAFTTGTGASTTGKPLFIAKDSLGQRQPIFAAPTIGLNQTLASAPMIYFGTGKYLNTDDVGTTQMGRVQSFYGIADQGVAIDYTLTTRDTVLHKKTMTNPTLTSRDVNDSGTAAVKVNWGSKKGWFLDFPAGERTISKPLLISDRLLFSTVVPSSDTCGFGGAGWLMELVGVGDTASGTEKLLMPTNGEYLKYYLPGNLIVLKDKSGPGKMPTCDITGDCTVKDINLISTSTRLSWRQIR